MKEFSGVRSVIPALVICLHLGVVPANAQITSTFQPVAGSTDWFNSANWNNGIPNAAGDTARIGGAGPLTTVNLTAPVTLGQLTIPTGTSATIAGNQALTFSQPGSDPALLQTPGATATIGVPVSIADGEQLRIIATRQISLNGSIVSSSGDIIKDGAARLSLGGNNSAWNGSLSINAGIVTVNNTNALGSAIGKTVLSGGTIQLNQSTNEPFVLSAGTLLAGVNLNLSGQLDVSNGSTAVVQGSFSLLGGTTGGGDLNIIAPDSSPIVVSNTALAHSGGVTINGTGGQRGSISFNVDSTYGGPTNASYVSMRVTTPNGLGSTDAGTTIANGDLTLNYRSQEGITLIGSTLTFSGGTSGATSNVFGGNLTLNNGTVHAYQQFGTAPAYAIANPIVLNGGTNTISPERGKLTINGTSGNGDLLIDLGDDVFVNGPIAHNGATEIRNGKVHLTTPGAIGGTVLVRNGGRIIGEADQHIHRYMTGASDESCCSAYGSIEAAPQHHIDVDQLDVLAGMVKGDIRITGPITFHGFGATISNLVSGVGVRLPIGQMVLDDSDTNLGPTTGAIEIGRESEAMVQMNRGSTSADFHLNNGSGFAYGGALRLPYDSTGKVNTILKGNVYLGDHGAYLGGEAQLRIEGQIYGGDLKIANTLSGAPVVSLATRTLAYTGETSLGAGEIVLSGDGRLANTSRVTIGPVGHLSVDISPGEGAISDRIADNVPIEMYGGGLATWPTDWGVNTAERLGSVVLKRGKSSLFGSHVDNDYANLHSEADLVVGELSREPGSILDIIPADRGQGTPFANEQGSTTHDLVLETPPPQVNGILPAWITIAGGFTSLGPGGRVRSYSGPTTTLTNANETSIVSVPSSGSTLDRDMTVYALSNSGPLDLGGHTLTVASGGVYGTRFTNGTIRPGDNSNGELILNGEAIMGANIVDNGSPTSVIYTATSQVSGFNSYTGKTYIVDGPGGQVEILRGESLPSGGDVEINGWGSLRLNASNTGYHFKFGNLTLRDNATLSGQCCDSSTNFISAKEIELESGLFAAAIEGNTPVVKTTDGIATFVQGNPNFTGAVDIYDGLLVNNDRSSSYAYFGYRGFGQGTVTVHQNGRLALYPAGDGPPTNVTLDGGSLYSISLHQEDPVNLVGTVNVVADSKIYLFDGVANDLEQANFGVNGSVNVAAGKTLELLGNAGSYLGPELIVSSGINLAPGAVAGR